jgi:hypothetical protein
MMAMYINRAPGIMATPHTRAEADELITEAKALSGSTPETQAAFAVAQWRSGAARPPSPRREAP